MERLSQQWIIELFRDQRLEFGGTGARKVLKIDGVGIARFEADPAAETIERITLIERRCAGPAAQLLAQAHHGLELGPGHDVSPPRVLPGRERREIVQALPGAVNPVILVKGLHGLSGELA